MTSLLSALAYSCPLILCSLGALFTEYAGCLACKLCGFFELCIYHVERLCGNWTYRQLPDLRGSDTGPVCSNRKIPRQPLYSRHSNEPFVWSLNILPVLADFWNPGSAGGRCLSIWPGRDAGGYCVCNCGLCCDGSLWAGAQPPRIVYTGGGE